MKSNFRNQGAQGSSRVDPAEMAGIRPIAGLYNVPGKMCVAEYSNSVHGCGQGNVVSMFDERAHSRFNQFTNSAAGMMSQAGVTHHGGFGSPSPHLMTDHRSGSPDEQPPEHGPAQHPLNRHIRGKQSTSPYYGGGLPHAHDSPSGPEMAPGVLSQHHLLPNGKVPKWAPTEFGGSGAHHDALTELARENILLKHQLNVATQEVVRLKQTLEAYHCFEETRSNGSSSKGQSRYWTEEEHQRFLDAIQNYGHKDVKVIASVVGTRSATQVRTHAQKYFIKLARSRKERQGSHGSSQAGNVSAASMLEDGDQDDMADDAGEEDMEGRGSMGATAAAAAAAWEAGPAGTSAAAAAAFVAASHNKQGEWKKGTDDMEETKEGSSSSSHSSSSNLAGAQIDLVNTSSSKGERKGSKASSRQRKRNKTSKDQQIGVNGGPGTPGSMGSSASLGSSDTTSNGNGSNGSNGQRSSDTTNGNGSSNGSNSNGHCNSNGSSGDSGGGVDSNNGTSSNEGSDHGFFDTAGEDGGNFSDELEGAGGGSDEGYVQEPSQPHHPQICLPNDNMCGDTDMQDASNTSARI